MPTTMRMYTAESAADSRPYLRARLMMTSIWYRPCLRIATVMTAGIPNSAMTGIAV